MTPVLSFLCWSVARDFPPCAEMAKADETYLRLLVDPAHATASDAELRALAGLPAPSLPRVATDPRTFVPIRPHRTRVAVTHSPRVVRST